MIHAEKEKIIVGAVANNNWPRPASTWVNLASFPVPFFRAAGGRGAGEKKRAWYLAVAHALIFPRFLGIRIFCSDMFVYYSMFT